MEICLVQPDPSLAPSNVKSIGQVIRNTRADLYVLPELFAVGFDVAAQKWKDDLAEVIPEGATCQKISKFLQNRSSVVIFGMIERCGTDFFNVAAVIGHGWSDRYRQKNAATTSKGSVLPIRSGTYRKIVLPSRWSMGPIVCSDHFAAEACFEQYQEWGVNSIVLIADSPSRHVWIDNFPALCKKHGLMAIVCNAAGPDGGGSCIISPAGEFIPLRISNAEYKYLPEHPLVASAVI